MNFLRNTKYQNWPKKNLKRLIAIVKKYFKSSSTKAQMVLQLSNNKLSGNRNCHLMQVIKCLL